MAKKIEKFEDLDVWKESMNLAVELYNTTINCNDYGFRDQIRRSIVSVPSNIAEGFERQSNKEFIQFLYIAKASCGELRTQLYLTIKINMIEKEEEKNSLNVQEKSLQCYLSSLKHARRSFNSGLRSPVSGLRFTSRFYVSLKFGDLSWLLLN